MIFSVKFMSHFLLQLWNEKNVMINIQHISFQPDFCLWDVFVYCIADKYVQKLIEMEEFDTLQDLLLAGYDKLSVVLDAINIQTTSLPDETQALLKQLPEFQVSNTTIKLNIHSWTSVNRPLARRSLFWDDWLKITWLINDYLIDWWLLHWFRITWLIDDNLIDWQLLDWQLLDWLIITLLIVD